MNTISTEIEIAADLETVWAVVMDPNRFSEWVTIHRSVSVKSADPTARGARMDQHMHLHGVSFKVQWTLAEVNAPLFAEWRGRGPAFSKALIRYQLKRTPSGGTRFRYTNEFNTPGGPLADFANRLVVGHSSEHEAKASLSQLKSLIEHN